MDELILFLKNKLPNINCDLINDLELVDLEDIYCMVSREIHHQNKNN